jgi:hypothetical protein
MNRNKIFKTHGILFLVLSLTETAIFSANAQNPSPPSSGAGAGKSSGDPVSPSVFLSLDNAPTVCPETFVIEETEGPYYKPGSPERTSLIEEGVVGEPFTLTGYVFDKDCNPVAGVWLDFWQADGNGNYDNAGYRLRGHQFTDKQGKYILKTVVPGAYPGRTNHIHVKVRKNARGAAITSQLFFPEGRLNNRDGIYHESLLVTMGKDSEGQKIAFFNFRLDH